MPEPTDAALQATLSTERLTRQIERSYRTALEAENARLRAALERIEAMAERPRCTCGLLTGTAAIKSAARAALTNTK